MRSTALVVFLCLGLPFIGSASDNDPDAPSLKGVKAMHVVIEGFSKDAPSDLTEDQVRTDLELKLRQTGITIADDAMPWLYVRIGTLKLAHINSYAYNIDVEFNQSVALLRDPKTWLVATTWRTGGFGESWSGQYIRARVSDYVDKFLNAYLSVNPR